MLKISISDEIKSLIPKTTLKCLKADVQIQEINPGFWHYQFEIIEPLQKKYELEDIVKIKTNAATRKAYKLLGKDPSRYRPSAEALLRRIIKGDMLFPTNNVVDIINLISAQYGISIGGYDINKIKGKICLKKGNADEPYEGIGRGKLNIQDLPVLYDDEGPFGSPTSDSERTKIDANTSTILIVCFDFDGLKQETDNTIESLQQYFTKYASAKNILLEEVV